MKDKKTKRKYMTDFDLYEERKNVSQGINDDKIFYLDSYLI